MRPLYVAGGPGVCLRLDGPSLVVEAPQRPLRRYPLDRLSQVILCGAVDASLQALRACASRGIPVGALAANGSPVGFFLPWRPEPPRPSQLFENFLHRADAESRFEDWRKSQERRAIIRALRAAHLPPMHYLSRRAAIQALLDQFPAPFPASRVLKSWLSLAAAVAQKAVNDHGICPTLAAGRRAGIDLPAALSEIAAWGHWEPLRRLPALPNGWAQEVQSYETQRARDEKLIRAVLTHFFCWLGGVRWQ